MTENTGIVLEGGGFRAIFVAAALEVFHRHHLFFPYAMGVSAGAAYGVSYVSRQQGRNLETNKYINDKRYCGIKHLLKNGDYFNWNFIYKQIPEMLLPLDYNELKNSSTRFYVALTHCETAQTVYLNANTNLPERLCALLSATSSLPFISKIKKIDEQPYLDGGISNAIPIEHGFENGCQKLVVVLTRPKEYRKEEDSKTTNQLYKVFYRKYPELFKLMHERASRYNKKLTEIEKLTDEGKIFIVRPNEHIPIGRLENNPDALQKVYFDAISEIEQCIIPQLKQWLQK
ncbi:MAG: patatin family protein [Lentimicrobiaceae bacterium]|jgi:predicted patatin/cPLA2 family phospholipase|nr:patatin family protein [Lentimicrobiaceae bacterium]